MSTVIFLLFAIPLVLVGLIVVWGLLFALVISIMEDLVPKHYRRFAEWLD